jgi:hypothetical protein
MLDAAVGFDEPDAEGVLSCSWGCCATDTGSAGAPDILAGGTRSLMESLIVVSCTPRKKEQ